MTATGPDPTAKRDLTSGPLGWSLFRLAAPTAAASIMHSLYYLVDAFWLGQVGKVSLAAPALTGPLFFIVASAGYGFGIGCTALVAQYTGAGRHEEAERAAGQTILLLCMIGLCMALPAAVLAGPLLRLFQAPADTLSTATGYLRIVMLGMPFMAFTMAYGASLRAIGDTITVVVILAVANMVNLVLDPFLIFGWWGFPAMGIRGAAYGTIIGSVFEYG